MNAAIEVLNRYLVTLRDWQKEAWNEARQSLRDARYLRDPAAIALMPMDSEASIEAARTYRAAAKRALREAREIERAIKTIERQIRFEEELRAEGFTIWAGRVL